MLPQEILDSIIHFSKEDTQALSTLSLVSKSFRKTCLPALFSRYVVTFTSRSFEHLAHISASPLAALVQEVEYRAPLLIIEGKHFSLC
jgi:hypothetical protein